MKVQKIRTTLIFFFSKANLWANGTRLNSQKTKQKTNDFLKLELLCTRVLLWNTNDNVSCFSPLYCNITTVLWVI